MHFFRDCKINDETILLGDHVLVNNVDFLGDISRAYVAIIVDLYEDGNYI